MSDPSSVAPSSPPIRLLGTVAVTTSGHDDRVPSAYARAVLFVLAMNAGTTVATDHLLDCLWEAVPKHPRRNLSSFISLLRKKGLGIRAYRGVGGTGGGYRLDVPRNAVDAHVFRFLHGDIIRSKREHDYATVCESARRGLSLWRAGIGTDLPATLRLTAYVEGLESMRTAMLADLHDAATRLCRPDMASDELATAFFTDGVSR